MFSFFSLMTREHLWPQTMGILVKIGWSFSFKLFFKQELNINHLDVHCCRPRISSAHQPCLVKSDQLNTGHGYNMFTRQPHHIMKQETVDGIVGKTDWCPTWASPPRSDIDQRIINVSTDLEPDFCTGWHETQSIYKVHNKSWNWPSIDTSILYVSSKESI